jgi:hypothetical protein
MSAFTTYMQKEILSKITSMMIPVFESKIIQKISTCENNLVEKSNKVREVHFLANKLKKMRQAKVKV